MPPKPTPKLNVGNFINQPGVHECLNKLLLDFNASNPLIVSEVIDENGNQLVHMAKKMW